MPAPIATQCCWADVFADLLPRPNYEAVRVEAVDRGEQEIARLRLTRMARAYGRRPAMRREPDALVVWLEPFKAAVQR